MWVHRKETRNKRVPGELAASSSVSHGVERTLNLLLSLFGYLLLVSKLKKSINPFSGSLLHVQSIQSIHCCFVLGTCLTVQESFRSTTSLRITTCFFLETTDFKGTKWIMSLLWFYRAVFTVPKVLETKSHCKSTKMFLFPLSRLYTKIGIKSWIEKFRSQNQTFC